MKSRAIALIIGWCVVCAYLSTAAADWPTYRADAARSGYTAEPLARQLNLQWVYRSPHEPRPAWPSSKRIHFDSAFQPVVIRSTVVFASSADDKVVALDAATGVKRWEFFTGGPIRFAPAAWRDRLFVASDDGWLYALAVSDGSLLWKRRGGPDDRKLLGNRRMISRWPARGGPVVMDDTVYFAAGIWPSDGIYLHALDAQTGKSVWMNDRTGSLFMPQPHGTAEAASGLAPQGYLLATERRLFVPTGRAVPAALRREDGSLEYYRLQQNGAMGGARAIVTDRFLANAGCLIDRDSGELAARYGRGLLTATPDGVLQYAGKTLLAYRWKDTQRHDRKGKPVPGRAWDKVCQIELGDESQQRQQLAEVFKEYPAFKNLYQMQTPFYDPGKGPTGLERTLSQSRPEVQSLGGQIDPFLASTYEKTQEVIAAANEAVCGAPGQVRVIDLAGQKVRWSHAVDGAATALAVSNGRLFVGTSVGLIYCFGAGASNKKTEQPVVRSDSPATTQAFDYAAAAEEIIKQTGVTEGFCLDMGCGTGQLALELAKRTKLQILAVEPDAQRVAAARRMLDAAGLYGVRVTVYQAKLDKLPFPEYFADLIVSSRALVEGTAGLSESEIRRIQRPGGGVVCLGKPGGLQTTRRKPLAQTGNWTHQNCDAANTICSTDQLARGPLEMLWFRDGVIEIPDRHGQGPAPLMNRGRLVVEGVNGICALDAYNGRTLWRYRLKGVLKDYDGVHHDVGVGDTGSNFCLGDESVFVRLEDHCLKLDLASGKKLARFNTPVEASAKNRAWGYVGCVDGVLYGSVLNQEHTVSPRYRDIKLRTESVLFFAMDAASGRVLWRYEPKHSIRNNTIAACDGTVYLIDRPLAMADRITTLLPNKKHRAALKPGEQPSGLLLAMDARTGKVRWQESADIFGTQLAVSPKHGVLLMYYQAVKHGFFKLPSEVGGRMAAFDAQSGKRLWDKPLTYKTRPIINDKVIYCEDGAWDLKSGGEVPFEFKRSYGCGQISGSTNLLLFRSATLGYHDLTRNVGTENFGGMRPGCWFNAIVGGGLVLVPDGSSKCACSYQMQAWLALKPKE